MRLFAYDDMLATGQVLPDLMADAWANRRAQDSGSGEHVEGEGHIVRLSGEYATHLELLRAILARLLSRCGVVSVTAPRLVPRCFHRSAPP